MNDTTYYPLPVERGCGEREAGGMYAECGMGPGGSPVEDFILCPPQRLDVEALGITPRGVRLIEIGGVWHIADWVGSQYYPNVADFLEEVRRFGLSRRLAANLDYSKLTSDSRVMLLHARAWVDNFSEYVSDWQDADGHLHNPCPKTPPVHDFHSEMCSGVWWQDIERSGNVSGDGRVVTIGMPSFTYTAAARPSSVTPHYQVAAFAVFPIHRIAVVRDQEGGKHEQNADRARESSLPVAVVEE